MNREGQTVSKVPFPSQDIILIEDDSFFGENLRDFLIDKGFSVQLFNNANEAIECVQRGGPPRIIIADIALSPREIDGLTAAEYLRDIHKSLEIVFLTNYADNANYKARSDRLGIELKEKARWKDVMNELIITLNNEMQKDVIFPSTKARASKKTQLTEKPNRVYRAKTKKTKRKDSALAEVRHIFYESLKSGKPKKGRLLEDVALAIIESIPGLKVVQRNARLKSEELDILVQNNLDIGFWRLAGSPIIVECKNLREKVSAREIGILADKLHSIGPDAKTALLITPSGISRDAASKAREKRQGGCYMIVLDRQALEDILAGVDAAAVIEKKYFELLLL